MPARLPEPPLLGPALSLNPCAQEFGTAVSFCDKALALDPASTKALLRRSRAHTGRHDYAAAEADVAALRQLDPLSLEAAEQAAAVERARAAHKRREQSTFAGMFERGTLYRSSQPMIKGAAAPATPAAAATPTAGGSDSPASTS